MDLLMHSGFAKWLIAGDYCSIINLFCVRWESILHSTIFWNNYGGRLWRILKLAGERRAWYRRPLARTSQAYASRVLTRVGARALGQSGRPVPPANQDAWALVTPRRPRVTSTHTAARHNWTRTPSHNIAQKAVFFKYTFPSNWSDFGHRAILIWVMETLFRGCS